MSVPPSYLFYENRKGCSLPSTSGSVQLVQHEWSRCFILTQKSLASALLRSRMKREPGLLPGTVVLPAVGAALNAPMVAHD